MATPATTRQGFFGFLYGVIRNRIRENRGNCKVYPDPLAVYLNRDNKTYLEPDIILVCDPGKMKEKGLLWRLGFCGGDCVSQHTEQGLLFEA